MKLNLNERVSATLTQRGAEVWNAWESQFIGCSFTTPKYKQAGDVLKEPLWHLFQVFGSSIHMGCQVPFEKCEIIIGENV